MLNGEKEKTICFVVATEDGRFPAVPVKKPEEAYKQMPICKKYRPEEKWKIWEVIQVERTYNGISKKEQPKVVGMNVADGFKFLNELKKRHEWKVIPEELR